MSEHQAPQPDEQANGPDDAGGFAGRELAAELDRPVLDLKRLIDIGRGDIDALLPPSEISTSMLAEVLISDAIVADKQDWGGFDVQLGVESLLHAKLGEELDARELSVEYQRLRKQFVLDVLGDLSDRLDAVEDSDGLNRERMVAQKIEAMIFSGSPNFVDYVGNFDDQADVLMAAMRVPTLRRVTWEARESMMQAITFSHDPAAIEPYILEKFRSLGSVDRLGLLKLLEDLAGQAADASYGDNAANILDGALTQIQSHGAALESLVAQVYRLDLHAYRRGDELVGDAATDVFWRNRYGLVDRYELPPNMQADYRVMPLARDALGITDPWGTVRYIDDGVVPGSISRDDVTLNRVIELAGHSYSSDEATQQIADWAAHSIDDSSIVELMQKAPDLESLGDQARACLHDLHGDPKTVQPQVLDSKLLQEIHRPRVRQQIERHLGVELGEVSLRAQLSLGDWLVRADRASFDRIGQVMHDKPELGADFLESFLALEQGEEFGESLLMLAEHLPPAELGDILHAVHDIREATTRMAEVGVVSDEHLRTADAGAVLLRTTQVLKAAEELIGQPQGYEASAGALTYEIRDFAQIQTQLDRLKLVAQGVAADGPVVGIKTDGEPQVQMVFGDVPVLVVTRAEEAPRGSQDKQWEIGKAMRINRFVIVDGSVWPDDLSTVDQAFLQTHCVSLRLDFQDGALGLDLGGKVKRKVEGSDGSETVLDRSAPDWRLAEVVAAGATLHAQQQGLETADYHVYDLLPMDRSSFETVVQQTRHQLAERQVDDAHPATVSPDRHAA